MNTQTKTPEGVKPPQLSFDEWWKLFLKGQEKMATGKWREEIDATHTDNPETK